MKNMKKPDAAENKKAAKTARLFANRRERADFRAFDKLMNRKRGEKPREGDEI